MKLPATILSALLLAASTGLYAQAPKGDAQARPRQFDCSKAKDPKACEERVAKMRASRDKAQKACEGKKGDEHRDCMQRQFCADTKDPAKCEARLKDRAASRERVREACKDKKGDDLKACIREHRSKK